MSFEERLQYLRINMNLTEKELADRLDISENAIRLYEKGKLNVTLDVLEKLANFFGVSTKLLLGTIFSNQSAEEAVSSYRIVQDLVEMRDLQPQSEAKSLATNLPQPAEHSLPSVHGGQVPVFNTIKRTQALNDDHLIEYWPVNECITRIFGDDLANYYYLYVHGDNMEPTLKDADTILVKKLSQASNNDIVVALTGFDDAVIARFSQNENQITLTYDNRSYPAETYIGGQCRIVGKVIWKTRL